MARPSAALRAESNLLQATACWARASGGGRSWEDDSLFCTSSPVPLRSFNQAFVTAPPRDPDALPRIVSWYLENGRRFRVRVRAELEDSMRRAAATAGLVRLGGMPCMGFEGLLLARGTELEVRTVTDEGVLRDHVAVVADAFGWEAPDLGRVFTPAILREPAWQAWVGYVDREPAATAQLVVHGEVAGLYYIGVKEGARGKGYGEAITYHAAREGLARGCHLVTLQASPAGYPLYRRLGFEVIGEYVTYVAASGQ